MAKGKPSRSTPADRRLTENQPAKANPAGWKQAKPAGMQTRRGKGGKGKTGC